ncbi:hypothetical protein JQ629_22610 [Bradyrhizobium sp. AUGA SZCCT0222]|uniref:hypothetical protein n=1 Tax=Bradyrhizobium sp. AUGA SZCCT0222 TaxID=2807668 RepID=UPI001BA6140F|nr:hypothetical protein [Bradyrhizobium sp. AUGA SZCCT0222]MBR1270271.1 hypothetical protein [Bradyrhizobium sp. AUGA SZCCT0222]
MRVVVLASLLLASSSLPSFAQGEGKPPISSPQSVPTQPAPSDQNAQQPRDQRTDRAQPKIEEREMGRDWRTRRGDGDRMSRDDREMGPEVRRSDREEYRELDMDRRRYSDRNDRDNRGWDRADRHRDYPSYDDDRPRRRVKICIEYDNGDEYCRYRQGP